MKKSEISFLGTYQKPNKEVFVDTIKAKCPLSCAMVGKEYGWTHEGKGDFYTKTVECGKANAFLIFKPQPEQAGLNPKEGSIFVQISLPKVLYGQNVTGFRYTSRLNLYKTVDKMLVDNNIYTQGIGRDISFKDFTVCRFDWSVSFFIDNHSELMSLFKKQKYGNCEPGKLGSKDYDYKNGFCHGSDSMDVVLYNKSEEVNSKAENNDKKNVDPQIADNIWRFEVRKKSGKVNGFNISVDNFLKESNKNFAKWLSHNIISPILPDKEYWELLKAKHEDSTHRSKPKSYSNRKFETLASILKEINEIGGYEFYNKSEDKHERDKKNYNTCKALANDAGIAILHTQNDTSINVFEEVCSFENYDKVFIGHNDNTEKEMSEQDKPSDTVKHNINLYPKSHNSYTTVCSNETVGNLYEESVLITTIAFDGLFIHKLE